MTALETVRYRGVVAYDGTDFFGFQRQAGHTPTIQGKLEAAVAHVTGQPVEAVTITGAGRTDTGVHAAGQVIAFDTVWRHTPHDLWRAINANLPDAIALQSLSVAEPGFHPRFDARSRAYEYTLVVAPVRQPCLRRYAWHIARRAPLDVDAMQTAAARLVGTHDFGTFGQPPQGNNTVRHVMFSEFVVAPDDIVIRYHIEANAFLYRMVRRIVGALVRVGSGHLTRDDFEAALRAADNQWPNPTAPAHGLCLTKVTY
ncbi:MAG: tRNA pseudouridine(38-40) synthase TruA [Anaerolineae bacterium]|nr:tRNA pseudouridine(38-40) synthase TruA [Anaerolineae bacterium]